MEGEKKKEEKKSCTRLVSHVSKTKKILFLF